MRTSIILWSGFSGLVLGLFVDAALIGLALIVDAIAPGLGGRLNHRWVALAATVVLALIPAAAVMLGILEGRLKTT